MIEITAALFLLSGSIFMLIAAVGALRLPDFYMRVHAITKAGTLGVGLILIGIAVFFNDLSVTTRTIAVFAFVLFTAPVAAHMIGRAGYLDRVPLWEGTLVDQLQEHYDDLVAKSMRPPPEPPPEPPEGS